MAKTTLLKGYDNNLISTESPLQRSKNTIGMYFDTNYEVQTRRMRIGKIATNDLLQMSGSATGVGTCANGTHVVFTSTITAGTGFVGKMLGGWCAEEIYEGTAAVGSMIIYPAAGGGIAADRWRISSGYRHTGVNDIDHKYQVLIYNNSGSTLDIYGVARWKYIMHGGGTEG